MNKINKFVTVAALALVFAAPIAVMAEDADPVISDAPVAVLPVYAYPGGYSAVCAYVLVYQKDCNPTDYSASKFALDAEYRESILAPWRLKIFGPNYNHQSN